MSRDLSTQSRIPRPGSGSRLPQLGSGRLKQQLESKIQFETNSAKLSRPTSFGSLRPPVTAMKSLKKSLSGDKISEAGNLLSKRTASVMKKFLTKPEKSTNIIETGFSKKVEPVNMHKGTKERSKENINTKSLPDTPKPLMRFETFISDGEKLIQSTPLVRDINKRPTTIYSTQSLDGTIVSDESNVFHCSRTIDETQGKNNVYFGNTMTLTGENQAKTSQSEDFNFGHTRILGDSQNENAFGRTVNVSHLINFCESKQTNAFGNTMDLDKNLINLGDKKVKLGSPGISNATKNIETKKSALSFKDVNDITLANIDSETTFTQSILSNSYMNLINLSVDLEDTLVLEPDKGNMNLVLNSTMHNERLLDLTSAISPAKAFMNISQDLLNLPRNSPINTTNLLYMTQFDDDRNCSVLEPFKSRSQISLPIKTPDEPMDIDDMLYDDLPLNVTQALNSNALQELKQHKPRFSFGLDLTECTLDCSIELCDVSLGSNAQASAASPSQLKKQNSFEMDESLGILTPDQMKEFLDSATTTTNLDLPLGMHPGKLSFHQMRVDQTPSPEDLPLDPVGVKTDINDIVLAANQNTVKQVNTNASMELSQTDTESKTDQMSKSNVSKISTSFITSVTSVTSLDTGYQGDGEMSRPASRGPGDHSPSNGPTRKSAHVSRQPSFNQNIPVNVPIRRQDPMTDSDFFTESDADDVFHRGDRRAQVIDGQLYGPMLQATASVFITEHPEQEDSCMESSGIFTDFENRCDDDIAQLRRSSPQDIDMSPDGSTDTVKSNKQNQYHNHNDNQQLSNNNNNNNNNNTESEFHCSTSPALSQGQCSMLTDSQTSSTINSSFSSDRISIGTADYKQTYSETKSSTEALSNETTKKAFTPLEYTDPANITLIKTKSSGKHVSLSSSTSLSSVHDVQNDYDCYKSQVPVPSTNNLLTSNSTVRITNAKIGSLNNRSNTSRKSLLSKSKLDARNTISNNCMVDRNDMLVKTGEIQKLAGNGDVGFKSLNSENQENKSPQLLESSSSSTSRLVNNTTITTGSPLLRKNTTTNKWDAVMNKIAVNKAQVKKNYNAVKSKVSTGVLRRTITTTTSTTAITSNNINLLNGKCSGPQDGNVVSGCSSGSPSGLQSPQTKRIIQYAAKRGRSFSKDSQQSSSQSDISSASPKLVAKTPQRAAKKRDVRNLTISPTDLGPPPKAHQTTFGSTRTKPPIAAPLSNKRTSTPVQQNVATPTANNKNTSTVKKTAQRRTDQKTHVKAPLKDHNRLVNQQQQQQQQNGNAKPNGGISNKTIESNGSGGGCIQTLPVSSTPNADKTFCDLANSEKGLMRGTQTPPSPILNNYNNNCINGPPVSLLHKKHQLHQQQQQQKQRPIVNNGTRLEFNSEEPTTPLEKLKPIIKPPTRDVEALGVLLNYLVYDLDAFSGPFIKKECEKSQNNLTKTLSLLDEAKASCHELQDQLQDKESFYSTREQELHALHRCELKKAESKLYELESNAKERIASLKAELDRKDEENDKRFNSYRNETDVKFAQKAIELDAAKHREEKLLERLNALEQTENALREKIQTAENNFAERLQSAAQRERELVEKVNTLSKQLDDVTKITKNRERELEEQLNQSQDEVSVLRLTRSFNEQTQTSGDSPRNSSNRACELQRLHSETESLRCVLEIKQKEISKLTKQNQELTRDAEESIAMLGKISTLESRCEMLQTELQLKSNKEKELREKYDDLKKNLIHETTIRTRLSFDNEALQWQLKQRSEQLHIVEGKLHESVMANVGKSSFYSQEMCSDLSHNSSLTSLHRTNGIDRIQFHMDDVSPPTSPIVKGVIEKTDSVSWVLEMDDETPEVAASKMVRRAGSFRSSINEKSPGARRQLSLTSNNSSNPLTQSASATSVIRQHSSDTSNTFNHSRTRSKSVSKSSEPKKVVRQNSGGSRKTEIGSSWKEPICCSSPYTRGNLRIRQQPKGSTSPVETVTSKQLAKSFCGETENGLSKRKQSRHLITCDISSLNSGEKLEMRSLPSHASVHDLKSLKKCQEIMESAGEAMVSGTNSEDEGCSASSDDIVSSSSGSSSSLGHKTHNMSIEEVLLLDKINTSLNGTPMEVSWSDDPDQFANESIV